MMKDDGVNETLKRVMSITCVETVLILLATQTRSVHMATLNDCKQYFVYWPTSEVISDSLPLLIIPEFSKTVSDAGVLWELIVANHHKLVSLRLLAKALKWPLSRAIDAFEIVQLNGLVPNILLRTVQIQRLDFPTMSRGHKSLQTFKFVGLAEVHTGCLVYQEEAIAKSCSALKAKISKSDRTVVWDVTEERIILKKGPTLPREGVSFSKYPSTEALSDDFRRMMYASCTGLVDPMRDVLRKGIIKDFSTLFHNTLWARPAEPQEEEIKKKPILALGEQELTKGEYDGKPIHKLFPRAYLNKDGKVRFIKEVDSIEDDDTEYERRERYVVFTERCRRSDYPEPLSEDVGVFKEEVLTQFETVGKDRIRWEDFNRALNPEIPDLISEADIVGTQIKLHEDEPRALTELRVDDETESHLHCVPSKDGVYSFLDKDELAAEKFNAKIWDIHSLEDKKEDKKATLMVNVLNLVATVKVKDSKEFCIRNSMLTPISTSLLENEYAKALKPNAQQIEQLKESVKASRSDLSELELSLGKL
jgi:hypothetical protein